MRLAQAVDRDRSGSSLWHALAWPKRHDLRGISFDLLSSDGLTMC